MVALQEPRAAGVMWSCGFWNFASLFFLGCGSSDLAGPRLVTGQRQRLLIPPSSVGEAEHSGGRRPKQAGRGCCQEESET